MKDRRAGQMFLTFKVAWKAKIFFERQQLLYKSLNEKWCSWYSEMRKINILIENRLIYYQNNGIFKEFSNFNNNL